MNKIFDDKAARFIIVGIINTIVGTAIMFSLYNLFGLSYWVSSSANYIITSILSFALNKCYTFRDKGSVVGSGFRFALNIGVCYLIAYGFAKPIVAAIFADISQSFQENVAMLAGMCIFTVMNYFGQRLFVFKGQKNGK